MQALRADLAEAAGVGAGDMVERTFEAERVLGGGAAGGRRYSQRMVVGYDEGGPKVGRMASAEFTHGKSSSSKL